MFTITSLTDEEEQLRDEVRSFLREELDPPGSYRPALGMIAPHDREFSRRLAARGWLGMNLPTQYGGHDRTAVDRFVVVEELLAAGAPVGAHWTADRQTAPTILRFGSEEQKQQFLPAIARGDCGFALGFSEPDSGSDLASVRTRAQQVDGGWAVTGTKVWTTGAHQHEYMMLLCRTSAVDGDAKHAGLSQFLVDLSSPGVKVSPIESLEGARHFNEVSLEDVFVPDDMVLGNVGDGWRQVTSELAYERAGPDRYLSTYPLLEFLLRSQQQVLQDPRTHETVGYLVARFRALRAMSLSVARAIDEGEAPAVQAAVVKDLGTAFEQELLQLVRDLLQEEVISGTDTIFHSLLTEAILSGPSFTLRGGTTEVLRGIVARGIGVR